MEVSMKNITKLVFAFFILTASIFYLGACDNGKEDEKEDKKDEKTDEKFMTQEEVEDKLKNYSFEYTFTYTEDGEVTSSEYIDMRTEEAWLFRTGTKGDTLTFLANKNTKSLYMLNDEEKTGLIMTLEDDFESFDGWGMHLFGWYSYADDFVKKGTKDIAGRTCTIYEYTFGTIKYTYYIDREYDLCLKFDLYESSANITSSFVYTYFQINNVKTEDIMDVLDGYEIEDYRGFF